MSLPVLGCLISGGGRTVLNLQQAIERGTLSARIGVVVVTKPGISGIDRCRAAGVPVVVCDRSRAESLDDQVDAALVAAGVEDLTLADGKKVAWAPLLAKKLLDLQLGDGSWANDTSRWMEKDPALVTSYCVLTLELIYHQL